MQQALYCRADGADKFKQVLQAGCGRLKAFVWRVFSGRRDSGAKKSRLNAVSVAVSMLSASFEVYLRVFKQLIFLYSNNVLSQNDMKK